MGISDAEPIAASGFLPPRWVINAAWKAHKALYRFSNGRFGLRAAKDDKEGLALLHTTGRRSGLRREVMIGYFVDGDRYVTMAMNGWDPADPAWWLNLQADPHATLTLADGAVEVVAEEAEGDDHDALWKRWRELDPFVDRNSPRRTNGTPVVVFHPQSTSG